MTTPPQGRLTLTICAADGRLVARREARNLVVKGGAQLIADLFSGKAATPIDRVRVGFGKASAAVASDRLDAPQPHPPNLEAPLTKENFTVDVTGQTAVSVRISAPFTPSADVAGVTEAGLFAGNILYNQVVFEPINLAVGHVITFFWQIDFPFGR